MTGVVRQSGVPYLFECLIGPTNSLNVWAYVPITETEEQHLETLRGEEIEAEVDRLLAQDETTVAVARDGQVLFSIVLPRYVEGNFADVALDAIDQHLEALLGETRGLQAALA